MNTCAITRELVLIESPLPFPNLPTSKWARQPKAPGELDRCIGEESVRTIRQERIVCVVGTAGLFIGCVDNVTCEHIAKGEKMPKDC